MIWAVDFLCRKSKQKGIFTVFAVSAVSSSLECRANKINPAQIQLKLSEKLKTNINVMPKKARYQSIIIIGGINPKQCQCSQFKCMRTFGFGHTFRFVSFRFILHTDLELSRWSNLVLFEITFQRCSVQYAICNMHAFPWQYGHRDKTYKLFICSLFIFFLRSVWKWRCVLETNSMPNMFVFFCLPSTQMAIWNDKFLFMISCAGKCI